MSWQKHITATLILGLPLIGSHLAQMATNITDVIMLGWYSVEALAATVLATQIWFVVFIVGSGFSLAVMPMVATAQGQQDYQTVRRSVRMGGWMTLAYFVLIISPLWFFEAILLALGQAPDLAALAQDYMRIALWGMCPAMLIMLLKSYLSALERTQIVLWATVGGALLNALADYVLIFGYWGAPKLGVRGAAIASVASNLLVLAILLGYALIHPYFKRYHLLQRPWRPDWGALWEVLRLGAPISLTLLAEAGLFAATSIMMGWVGTIALATHGIVVQIASVSFMIPLGLSNVATIRLGLALGQQDNQALWRASVTVIAMALLVSLVTMTLFLTIPEYLVRLFLDPTAADADNIISYGMTLLAVAAAFQICDAMQVNFMGLLRGLKDTTAPMLIAIAAYWLVGVPAGYWLGFEFEFGGVGIWSGLVMGLSCAAVALAVRFIYQLRMLNI